MISQPTPDKDENTPVVTIEERSVGFPIPTIRDGFVQRRLLVFIEPSPSGSSESFRRSSREEIGCLKPGGSAKKIRLTGRAAEKPGAYPEKHRTIFCKRRSAEPSERRRPPGD